MVGSPEPRWGWGQCRRIQIPFYFVCHLVGASTPRKQPRKSPLVPRSLEPPVLELSPGPPCPPSCGQNRPIPWALYRHLPNSLGGNLQIRSPRQAPGALGAGHDLPGREEPGSQDAPAPWVGADRHQARAALGRRGERTASRWCRPCAPPRHVHGDLTSVAPQESP